MDCECYATKGIGETHAKWSPVCTAAYRMRPQINLCQAAGIALVPAPVTGEDAERLRGTCPMGVFDIEDLAGTSTLVVGNDLNCT